MKSPHDTLEDRVLKIEQRNKKVENDKAWEQSLERKASISIVTYTLIGLYLMWLDVESPWLNAVVPTIGYLLSTLALSMLKKNWIERRDR